MTVPGRNGARGRIRRSRRENGRARIVSGLAFPLEVLIRHIPVSHQSASSASKDRWRRTVAEHARACVGALSDWTFLDDRPLSLTILYFPPGSMQGDIDNIAKLIMAALIGVVYLDDRVIERLVVQKFEPAVAWHFQNPPPRLNDALETPPPAVYVRVDDDMQWRGVP